MEFIQTHIIWFVVLVAVAILISLLRVFLKKRKIRRKQEEDSALLRRNEALEEALRNPIGKNNSTKAGSSPMEIKWDEKAVLVPQSGKSGRIIELVEFSAYSKRKYLFQADRRIRIGSQNSNDLVLTRDGVAPIHCEIVPDKQQFCIRSLSDNRVILHRGKTSAFVGGDGVYLNDDDQIELGSAYIQYRSYKA